MKENQRIQLWILLGIVAFGFIGISMPYLIFPALFMSSESGIFTADASESTRALLLGITLAAYPAGQFIGSFVLGTLSDHLGRRRVMVLSLIAATLASLITYFSLVYMHLMALIISRFISGLMEGNISIARAAAIDLTSLSKHETLGKVNAATSVAYAIGPLVGGLLSDPLINENFSSSTPFFIISILFGILSVLSFLLLRDQRAALSSPQKSLSEKLKLHSRLKELFSKYPLKTTLIASTLLTLSIDLFHEFVPVYLNLKWNLSPANLSPYVTVAALSTAIGSGYLTPKLSQYYSGRSVTLASMFGFASTLLVFNLADTHLLVYTGMSIMGVTAGIAITQMTVEISDSVPASIQGEVMGIQGSLRVLGDAFICLLGGVLIAISPICSFLFSSFVIACTMVYYSKRTKQKSYGA